MPMQLKIGLGVVGMVLIVVAVLLVGKLTRPADKAVDPVDLASQANDKPRIVPAEQVRPPADDNSAADPPQPAPRRNWVYAAQPHDSSTTASDESAEQADSSASSRRSPYRSPWTRMPRREAEPKQQEASDAAREEPSGEESASHAPADPFRRGAHTRDLTPRRSAGSALLPAEQAERDGGTDTPEPSQQDEPERSSRFAGQSRRQDDAAATRTYVVSGGESIFDIARAQLGKAVRWHEIYELNRDVLGDDVEYLEPGTELTLPPIRESAEAIARRRGSAVRR